MIQAAIYYLFQLYILPMNKENLIHNYSSLSNNEPSNTCKSCPKARKNMPRQIMSSRNDHHDDIMRLIIAKNSQYFKNKVVGAKGRGVKELKLKIPCQTGNTIYRQDYKEKQLKDLSKSQVYHNGSEGNLKNQSSLKMCFEDIKLEEKTSYQQDYRNKLINSLSSRAFNKKIQTDQDHRPPGFFQTNNKSNFLNWGGHNFVVSMKPAYKSSATNLAFQGTSSYRAEFEGKQTDPAPIYTNQSSISRLGNISTALKSKYSYDFSQKKYDRKNRKEQSFKPNEANTTLGQQFKGATEYKRQFKKSHNSKTQESQQFHTLQDLQNLIIDL